VSRSSRLRSQEGFIRGVVWIALVIAVIALVVLDGMAIFAAHQSVADDSTTAAEEARTEYAQSQNLQAAKLAASGYLVKSDLELVRFSAKRNDQGDIVFSVTAKATADTRAFKLLGKIPPFKKWVQQVTHPVGTGTAQ
jgi:hypothetical protein